MHMTGWLIATATTAMLGAAAMGSAGFEQALRWNQSDEGLLLKLPEMEQAVRVFAGSGGQIGVTIRDLGEADLKGKAAGSSGVVIDEVETDSPASKAGFKAGDVVVEFDGERVRSTRQFTRLVLETPQGRSIATVVLRDGQRVTLNVQPREGGYRGFKYFDDVMVAKPMPKTPRPPMPPAASLDVLPKLGMAFGMAGRLGATVEDLTPQLGEYFGVKEGVLVKAVSESSVAAKAGIKAGDVITALDGGAITTAADLRRRAQRLASGDEFTLGIVRDKKTMSVKGKMEETQIRRSRTIL
jgi:serine protease Do